MRHGRNGRSGWTAHVVALLIVVQAVLLAFSTGASAGSVERDQFGNIICSAGETGRHDGGPSSSHDRHAGGLDCCTVGCPMFGGPALSSATDLRSAAQPLALLVPFALHENLAAAGVPASPRNAQGPPPSA